MQTLSFTGPYSIYTSYKSGDYVLYAGKLYKCLLQNSAVSPQNGTYWQLVSNTFTMRGSWQTNTQYYIGQSVIYNNTGYICLANTTVLNQSPDIEPSFWRVFNNNYQTIVTNQPGDLQYEGNTVPQRLPIGNTSQILSISGQGNPFWITYTDLFPPGSNNQVLHLSPNGNVYWANTLITLNKGDLQYQGANGQDVVLAIGSNSSVLVANTDGSIRWDQGLDTRVVNLNQKLDTLTTDVVNNLNNNITLTYFLSGSI
jgi:hypothetical protein